jgi:hypothetical protein
MPSVDPDPPPATAPAPENGHRLDHARLLAASFRRLTGRRLLTPDDADDPALGQRLYEAPFAVLSHGTGADPLFTYANRTALQLFELDWPALIRTPSRLSAEPVAQAERARLLAAVARQGFIADYRGVRISRRGRRFRIDAATVWTLSGQDGAACGQAAMFADWVFL